jgi:peptidyl-prolyl cis-trans isomerase C
LVRQYYDAHLDEFVRPEYRRASMLVVATDAEARALLPQLQIADMRAFRDLARNKSTDAVTRQRGGDVRYFDASGHSDESEPTLDAKLAKAVFSLKNVGDITPIVQVEKTYVVAKLTGLRAAQSEPLKLADDRIRMRLWRERRQAAIDAKLAALRTELHAEVHPELVDSVQVDNSNTPLPPDRGLPDGFPQVRPGPVLSPPQP